MKLSNNHTDKIRGFALGTAIGDALGVPMETWTPEQIRERFGFVTDYMPTDGHKWAQGRPIGSTSDDWQLTKLVMDSVGTMGRIDMDDIARQHVVLLSEAIGWGGSTREAVQRLAAGTPWWLSGISEKAKRGTGNGVAMKIGGIAILTAMKRLEHLEKGELYINSFPPLLAEETANTVCQFAKMTHATPIGIGQAFAHLAALEYCLLLDSSNFDADEFLAAVELAAVIGHEIYGRGHDTQPKLHPHITNMRDWPASAFNPEHIIREFGSGFSAEMSLPSAYAYFVQDPHSIQSLYNAVNGGGDTDSVGALVGGMLGALNGEGIFPAHLLNGLVDREQVLLTADNFIADLSDIHS